MMIIGICDSDYHEEDYNGQFLPVECFSENNVTNYDVDDVVNEYDDHYDEMAFSGEATFKIQRTTSPLDHCG